MADDTISVLETCYITQAALFAVFHLIGDELRCFSPKNADIPHSVQQQILDKLEEIIQRKITCITSVSGFEQEDEALEYLDPIKFANDCYDMLSTYFPDIIPLPNRSAGKFNMMVNEELLAKEVKRYPEMRTLDRATFENFVNTTVKAIVAFNRRHQIILIVTPDEKQAIASIASKLRLPIEFLEIIYP